MPNSDTTFVNTLFFQSLFPATYLLHIAEEYWGGEGYPAYLLRVQGVHFSGTRFWVLQSIGIALMIAGLFLARRLNFPHFLVLILSTVFFKNAATHIVRSSLSAAYEPGLVTSLLLWLPLGAFTLFNLRRLMSGRRYLCGLAIGLAICVAIELMTKNVF